MAVNVHMDGSDGGPVVFEHADDWSWSGEGVLTLKDETGSKVAEVLAHEVTFVEYS